jgi:hypothetical protein
MNDKDFNEPCSYLFNQKPIDDMKSARDELKQKMNDKEQAFVYRVYNSYHYDDESGTTEYGTYSTLEKAKKRLAEVVAKDAGKLGFEIDPNGRCGWQIYGCGDRTYFYISEIPLDKDVERDCNGYT